MKIQHVESFTYHDLKNLKSKKSINKWQIVKNNSGIIINITIILFVISSALAANYHMERDQARQAYIQAVIDTYN